MAAADAGTSKVRRFMGRTSESWLRRKIERRQGRSVATCSLPAARIAATAASRAQGGECIRQRDGLDPIAEAVGFLAGMNDDPFRRLDIVVTEIKFLGQHRGRKSFDFNGPTTLRRNFQHQIDLGTDGGPVKPRLRARRRSGEQVFEDKALATPARHGLTEDGVEVAQTEQGVHQTAVAHLHFG